MSDEDYESTTTKESATSITLPVFKEWPIEKIYDYTNQIIDYHSLEELNGAINAARLALFKATKAINKYEREEKTAKLEYERAFRREFIRSVEKTSEGRRQRAELACEDLENKWLVAEQVKKEFERVSYSLRLELQTLQGISNNYRQQMRME